jgi:hypothetical protein
VPHTDQTGSGWAGTSGVKDIKNIDAEMLTVVAAEKALKSKAEGDRARQLHGNPRAASGRALPSLMLGGLQRRNVEEGRSFMSGKRAAKHGSGKVFGDNSRCAAKSATRSCGSPHGQDGLTPSPSPV